MVSIFFLGKVLQQVYMKLEQWFVTYEKINFQNNANGLWRIAFMMPN